MITAKETRKLQIDEVKVVVSGNLLVLDPVRVRTEHTGRQVRWTCTGGRMVVSFDKGAQPFKKASFSAHPSEHIDSGECEIKEPGVYDYTITVHPTGGKHKITIDPQVDVDNPGTPLPE